MARLARVLPAREGLTFPMPNGLDFPAEGADVDIDDLFWRRRLLDGDVVEAAAGVSQSPPAPTEDARKKGVSP